MAISITSLWKNYKPKKRKKKDMSITYGASAGAIVTSYAMDETLGDQTQQSGNNTVVVSDDIVTAGNGQIDTAGYYGTYVGRKVFINLSGIAADEERVVVSQANGTGNTVILTVHEDWDTNPAQNDTIHVTYMVPDIDEAGGIGFAAKTGIWELTNKLTVGNGTDEAGLFLSENVALELDDRDTTYDLIIENNGRFDIGYQLAGVSVNGGHLTCYDNADGEAAIHWMDGAGSKWFDAYVWSQLKLLKILQGDSGTAAVVAWCDCKFINLTYDLTLFDTFMRDTAIVGKSGANDFLMMTAECDIDRVIVIQTKGWDTIGTDTTVETLEVRNCSFISTSPVVTVASNKTWNFVNPIWDPSLTDQTDFDFLSGTGNTVNWKISVAVIAQEADGTKLQNAMVIVYEDTQLADLVIEDATDVNGEGGGDFLFKNIDAADATSAPTVTTYGGHVLRVDKWLYQPFIAALLSDEKYEGVVTLLPDSNIVQIVQATAKSAGSGVTWNEDTNPSCIISYTGGSGTLSVGNTVTGGSGAAADGVVTKIVAGDSTEGTVHLKSRDAATFYNTESLSNGSGWTATLVKGSQQNFSIWIDANDISMQALYDYLAAITSETTLGADGEKIHEWGRDQQARALYLGASGFYTDRFVEDAWDNGSRHDNGFWQALTGSWDGANWDSETGSPYAIVLDPAGAAAWRVDFRPTKIRFTETESGDNVTGTLKDNAGTPNTIATIDFADLPAEWPIEWVGEDLDTLTLTGASGTWEISKIEFLIGGGKGVFITNFGSGSIEKFTDDTGRTWTPPTQYDHVLTGLELNTEITYVTKDTATELFHVENASVSDGDGKYKTTYTHLGGAEVDILIHHVDYKPDISNIYGITLPNGDTSVKVKMFDDENYFNPT